MFSIVHCLEEGVEGFHRSETHHLPVPQIDVDAVEHRPQETVTLAGVCGLPELFQVGEDLDGLRGIVQFGDVDRSQFSFGVFFGYEIAFLGYVPFQV